MATQLTSCGYRAACCWRWLIDRSARGCRICCSVSAIPTSTTTTSTVAAVTTATATTIADHLGEARVDLLLGLLKDINQVAGLLLVWKGLAIETKWKEGILTVSGEKGDGGTLGTGTASTANTVDVILRVVRVVVVQHVSNVADILIT